MNIANIFSSAQSVLVMLAGLVTLAEHPGVPGTDKKAAVLQVLDPALDALPVPGLAGTALKAQRQSSGSRPHRLAGRSS